MRILVVEDHPALARFITVTLESAGWSVIGPAADHSSAMEAAQQRGFDVAIVDRILQGEEAFAIADMLVEHGMKCLLISGYPRSTLPERLRGLPYLEKPFTMPVLLAAVAAIATRSP